MVPENDEKVEDQTDGGEGGDDAEAVAVPATDEYKVEKVDREAETPKPRNRAERRKDAMREATTKREAAEAEARTAREEAAQARRELAEIRGRLDERDRHNAQSAPSKHQDTLDGLRSQWETHAAAAVNPKLDEATRRDHIKRAHALETEMTRVQYKMFREEEQRDQPADQSEARRAAEREEAYLVSRFPWLEDNEEAHGYAWTKFNALVKAGRPRNRATMVEACTHVAKIHGFGGTANGDGNGNSRRYAAVDSGEGASGEDSPMTIRISEADKGLARALYPGDDEATAIRKFMKEVAVPHVRSKQKSA